VLGGGREPSRDTCHGWGSDGNRFDCRSLRVWRGPERRLYTDLFSEYFSFGIMMMPIKNQP
jgi:hypothetical protein